MQESFSLTNYEKINDISNENIMYDELNKSILAKEERSFDRFHQRLEHLHQICNRDQSLGLWSLEEGEKYKQEWVRNDNFVVVSKRSFLVCVIPKCGSSSWHWLARDMRDPLSTGHKFGWQDRQKNTEISQELAPELGTQLIRNKNSFITIAVRHPFAKLISGWNDKLASDITYSSFVLEAYPHMQKYANNLDPKHVLRFEDLAEYIAAYGHDLANLDYHFMPMQNLCRPCLYPYNHVVKLESLSLDEKFLKMTLNVSSLPWEQKGSKYYNAEQSNPVDIIRSYFSKIRKSTIRKLMKLYYHDFALFGYTFDVDTLTAGGFL